MNAARLAAAAASKDAEGLPLPRELAPGVFWLGNCQGGRSFYQGISLHSYGSVYVVVGTEASAIIECPHPTIFSHFEEQLDSVLARGIPDVKYILPTHQETPHSGGVGRLLQRFPDAIAGGNIDEYHLVYPQYADRFRDLEIGDSIDLGGRRIDVLESPFRDLRFTRWFFDTAERVLFSGDGFSYSHFHGEGQCGKVAEEAPELALPEMIEIFSEKAFWWTQFVDIEPYVAELEWLLETTGARTLAPSHGLPVANVPGTLPALIKGMRMMPRPQDEPPPGNVFGI